MKSFFSVPRFHLLFLLLAAVGLLTTACSKDEAPVDYGPIDDAIIVKYLADKAITTAQKQPSGLYFVPTTTNATTKLATVGTNVSIRYTATLLDGTVFDATSLRNNKPFDFILGSGSVIKGWDEGIALMRKGEKAILIIPSALAYGPSSPSTTITANSVLRFEVEVVDVK